MRRFLLALTLLAAGCNKTDPPVPVGPTTSLASFTPATGGKMRLVNPKLYIDETPVTQEVYQKVMGVNPSKQKNPQALDPGTPLRVANRLPTRALTEGRKHPVRKWENEVTQCP